MTSFPGQFQGIKISPRARHHFSELARAAWVANPEATEADVRRLTGAPTSILKTIRSRLIAAGVVRSKFANHLRAG